MKITFLLSGLFLFFLMGSFIASAQNPSQRSSEVISENDTTELLMYKFEPDFLVETEKQKAHLKWTKEILDTMDISDQKRRRLLKDIRKNTPSKRLLKALYTANQFENP